MAPNLRGRYAGLDVLRFIAASSVMLFHLGFWTWAKPTTAGAKILHGAAAYPALTQFAWFGSVGVLTFFVISGFVIAFSASRSTSIRFLRARFLRLFPGALVCATITLAALLWADVFPAATVWRSYLHSILFVPVGPWIDNVYWTLGVEIVFYAFVFGHLLIGRFNWFENTVTLLGFWSLGFIVAALLGNDLAEKLVSIRYGQLVLIPHGVYFALGAQIWLIAHAGANARRLAMVALFTAGGLIPLWTAMSGTAREFAQFGLTPFSPIAPCAFWLVTVAAIWAAVRLDRPLGAWGPRIALLGLATYPLYLLHYRPGSVMIGALVSAGMEQYTALALTILLFVALSVAVTKYPERALRNLLDAALPRRM